MIIIIGIYVFLFLLLWWGYFGYHILLYLFAKIRTSSSSNEEIRNFPSISVLIPCYNEESLVEEKIENLLNLDYPREKLDIIFLDGCSTDTTVSKINKAIQNIPYMRVIQTNKRGKIAQLNYILPEIKTDIIVNTDVDARLSKNALIEIVKEFQSNPKVAVVGGLIIPQNCIPEELQHWKTLNQMRVLESKAYSTTIVIAGCYAFRRGLIKKFPDNVVADDIYIPFEANLKGYKSIYSPKIVVFETRGAKSMSDLIKHKFRKINAYIIEVLRFLRYLPRLNPFWKVIFITRGLQILGLSWILLAFLAFSVFLAAHQYYQIILWFLGISVISLAITHKMIAGIELPETQRRDNFWLSLKMFFVATFLLILAGLTYPFYKQDSSYKKIK